MVLQIQCILLITLFSSAFCNAQNVIADTVNGQVIGVTSTTLYNVTYNAFIGIPYAQPPIGDLRFAAPIPVVNWTSPYNATYAKDICMQSLSDVVKGSEDCLYLNVYTPKLPSATDDVTLPVLFWIHGGGYALYSGDLGLSGANRFINKDVIVVSANYRLGLFGFLSTEDSNCPGNYGLKDLVLALEWIQNNIQYFGGDPTRVTIMGQDTGAASVQLLLLSERAIGLFQGGIAQSGDALSSFTQTIAANYTAFSLGSVNNISALNSEDLIEGLRGIDAVQLQSSVYQLTLMSYANIKDGLQFAPVIEAPSDEAVVTGMSYEKMAVGNFTQVPLLHGFNSHEFNTQLLGVFMDSGTIVPSSLVPADMHANSSSSLIVGNDILALYFDNQTSDPNFNSDAMIYLSDHFIIRPTVKSSELQMQYCPVYLYQFSFGGGVIHDSSMGLDDAEHFEELQFLWTNTGYNGDISISTQQTSPDANLTTERMLEMWSSFIKTGNPTLSANVSLTWPVVNVNNDGSLTYLNIGYDLEIMQNPRETYMEFWDEEYSTYGQRPYNTY